VHTVAVIIDQKTINDAGGDIACTTVGYTRTVQVRPSFPLDGRPIIDGHTGLALPLA
jgi:hypothetical protein